MKKGRRTPPLRRNIVEKFTMELEELKKKDMVQQRDVNALIQACGHLIVDNKRSRREYRQLKKEINRMYLIFITICLSLFLFELGIVLVRTYL